MRPGPPTPCRISGARRRAAHPVAPRYSRVARRAVGDTIPRDAYFEALCIGGYPAVQRLGVRSRRRWFSQYVRTVLQREVEAAGDIRRAGALAAMVRYFAATTGQELVISTVAERLGIDRSTAAGYEPWLETVFLVHRLPPWSAI